MRLFFAASLLVALAAEPVQAQCGSSSRLGRPVRSAVLWPFRRARASSGYSYSPVQKATPVQADEPVQKGGPTQKGDAVQKSSPTQKSFAQLTAERKAGIMASRQMAGHYFHGPPAGNGFSAEGCGAGMTPEAALGNCCRFNRPVVARATARGRNGVFYGVILYR